MNTALAALIGGGLWSFGVFGQPNLCGDVNGDGDITIADARQIMKCATHRAECPESCDVTGDGRCNTSDARMVQRAVAQQLSSTDFQCPVAETLTLTVVSDKESYEIGETPILTFTLTNVSDAPVEVNDYVWGNFDIISAKNAQGDPLRLVENQSTDPHGISWRTERNVAWKALNPNESLSFKIDSFSEDTHQINQLIRLDQGLEFDGEQADRELRAGIPLGLTLEIIDAPTSEVSGDIFDTRNFFFPGRQTFTLLFSYSFTNTDGVIELGPVISNPLEITVQ